MLELYAGVKNLENQILSGNISAVEGSLLIWK
jgi:hypothetical protein